ncbi:MAG: hypothetical protein QGI45_00575 [Myxococcota bacterium]|nr:hypothetical protein [Myxococcota bacterium]
MTKQIATLTLVFLLVTCTKDTKEAPDPRKVNPALVDQLTKRVHAYVDNHVQPSAQKPTRVHLVLTDQEESLQASSSASSVHTAAKFAARDVLLKFKAHQLLSAARLAKMDLVVTLFFKGSHLPPEQMQGFGLKDEGLVIRQGYHEWLYSPYGRRAQVKDPRVFLASACKAAALAQDCFDDPGITLYRYPTAILTKDGLLTAPSNDHQAP